MFDVPDRSRAETRTRVEHLLQSERRPMEFAAGVRDRQRLPPRSVPNGYFSRSAQLDSSGMSGRNATLQVAPAEVHGVMAVALPAAARTAAARSPSTTTQP